MKMRDDTGGFRLAPSAYRNRVHACWIGKNIGGTLGAPYEGPNQTHALTFYDPPPEKAAPNDDLDMQLAFLVFMEEHGRFPDLTDHVGIWKKYFCGYPWDEYGFCLRNLNRGLLPPLSGWFENSYIDNMGSPIRSEIWACLAPGDPQKAACLAWHDAVLDHAGGEGVWGEMFWAALQSAAFVCNDRDRLLDIGLAMIPPWSRIARVIRDVRYCVAHRNGVDVPWNAMRAGDTWGQVRERIAKWFGHEHGCHAVQNHGFTVLGWLLGQDFGDALCKAVNCGCDTDCTGATLGATLGIVHGLRGIPARWRAPVGDEIVWHFFTKRGCTDGLPTSVADLTQRVCALLPRLHGADHPFATDSDLTVSEEDLFRSDDARQLWHADILKSESRVGTHRVEVFFMDGTVLYAGRPLRLRVLVDGVAAPAARFDGQPVRIADDGLCTLSCDKECDLHQLRVTVPGERDPAVFVVPGPSGAPGYPAYCNIEKCKVCGGSQPARCKCVLGY
jgi:ADP-ribosylglycohydrolase